MITNLKEELKQKSDDLIKLDYVNVAKVVDEIAEILSRIDSTQDPILRAADRRSQDYGTYFLLAYSDTRDLEKSLNVYRSVKSLVRHILLKDRYYETGKKEYLQKTQELMMAVMQNSSGHVEYSLEPMINKISAFWDFERMLRQRILNGRKFSNRELRNYNLFKSSDTTWYSLILDSELKSFNPNVSLLLHYNQALLDIRDDFDDIEEDLIERMPNIFILAESGNITVEKLFKNPKISRYLLVNKNRDKILSLVNNYELFINSIVVPQNFRFLKILSSHYIKDIRSILNKI